jgi:hypothetical protein
MTRQHSFTADEWTLLRLAPSLVWGEIIAAEPTGIFASIKEAVAGARGMTEAFRSNSELELFRALAADQSIPGFPDPKTLLGEGPRDQQMQNFKAAVLEHVRAAVDLVAQKASPAEAGVYRKMLVDIAERAANASKEGGFLGFGGVRVSDSEQAFINEVKRAAGIA